MISFRVDFDHGHLVIGDYFAVSWGNPLPEMVNDEYAFSGLPGFFALSIGDYCLEMGEVDQDAPGIYLTKADPDGDVRTIKTFAQF